MLDYNILMLVHPSSGEHTFYKFKDANSIVMTDSIGNEPEGETAKHYVLKKEKVKNYATNKDSWIYLFIYGSYLNGRICINL